MTAVQWAGEWEHAACGASGEDTWDDESAPYSHHECAEEASPVTWSAEWTCGDCSDSGGVDIVDDGSVTYSDQECAEE
ncbi:hypothetical protein ACFV3E_41765 [Streptomyces sp. NPDC059718]